MNEPIKTIPLESLEQMLSKYKAAKRDKRINTFSKWVTALIMLLFFWGAAVATYAVVFKGESVNTLLDYIMKLALPVGIGYLIKAFGENVAKIVISALYGVKFPNAKTGDDI
jgi:hypothetical protein